MTQPMLEVTGAVKAFGTVTALSGVDLAVAPGRIAALLGPNGAGKTTLVRIVATLVRPDAGVIRVDGFDVVADPYAVRARIGLTGQYAGLDEALSGRANLMLIGRLAGLRRGTARERAAELIGRFDLAAAAGRAVGTYSGGMRRRADLAASLMTRPLLLVLDEPTTGLDPAGRRQLWESLATLRDEGTTMLLTTQYLEEAERLADLVYILDQGELVASGTPGPEPSWSRPGSSRPARPRRPPARWPPGWACPRRACTRTRRPGGSPWSPGTAWARCWRWRRRWPRTGSRSRISACADPAWTRRSWP